MVYYDYYGHLVPFGEEKRYYDNNNMWPSSRMEYEMHKVEEKRNKEFSERINKREPIMISRPKLHSEDSEESICKVKKEPYVILNFNPLKRHEID